MPGVIPNSGVRYITATMLDTFTVAVGTSTQTPTASDTALGNRVYDTTTDGPNASVRNTSEQGVLTVTINVSGGTEVEAGTAITELGVFGPDDNLLYRETRPATTIEAGDRVRFEFSFGVSN